MVNGFISTLLNDFAKRCQIETLEFDEEGKPAFDAHALLVDAQVKVHANKDRDQDGQGGPEDHLGR